MKMCDRSRTTVVYNNKATKETSSVGDYHHNPYSGGLHNNNNNDSGGESSDVLSFSSSDAQFSKSISSSAVVSQKTANDANDENDTREKIGSSQLEAGGFAPSRERERDQERSAIVRKHNKANANDKRKGGKKKKSDKATKNGKKRVMKEKTVKKAKNTIVKKKKEKESSSGSKKQKASKKTKSKSADASSSGQKRKTGTKTSSSSSKATSKKQKVEEKVVIDAAAEEPDMQEEDVLDEVYERHKRELEKALSRLEKVDTYAFFLDYVPPEFDERYDDDGKITTTNPNNKSNGAGGTTTSTSSSPPPYNFEIVRRRMEHGRYVMDRVKIALEAQTRLVESLPPEDRNTSKKNKKKEKKKLVLHKKGVHWDLFRQDIIAMCKAAVKRNPDYGNACSPGTLSFAAKKITNVVEQLYERTGLRQMEEMTVADDRHKFSDGMDETANMEAAMQGKWRREAFPERKYERLASDVVCAGLSERDECIASYELRTSLPDKFVGVSYKYDDTSQSEEWMKSVLNETNTKKTEEEAEERQAALALAEDDGVIRAQVTSAMSSLLTAVQDRVMTENGVLHQRELRSANFIPSDNHADAEWIRPPKSAAADCKKKIGSDTSTTTNLQPEIAELPVWGIDCYTRQNITLCLTTEFDEDTVLLFIEKWLLPAINACPVDLAHNMCNAALILEGLPSSDQGTPAFSDDCIELSFDKLSYLKWSRTLLGKALLNKIKASAPPWLKAASQLLRRAFRALGVDFFRVHPKGQGSVVLSPVLEANSLITFYCGEVYPSWRWGEKIDAIEMTQQSKALKPALPDFYNMALERPQSDPRQYGLLFVDASRKAGHGSFLSHSCEPTCEVRVAALNGKLCLAMTTLRRVEMGEELTFDYNAITESLNEYRSAICLCGHSKCRGSFLHYAMAECYQQVLNRNSPIAIRFANLAKGCMKKVMSSDDESVLQNHGFFTAIFGAISMNNHRNAADNADEKNIIQDSMDIVPIWLRTFVADTLRYVEYERRALPISLICDHIASSEEEKEKTTTKKSKKKSSSKEKKQSTGAGSDSNSEEYNSETDTECKPINSTKPESPFSYFLRVREHILYNLLLENGFPKTINGPELKSAIEQVASNHWNALSEKEKGYWKEQADEEWEKNGAREKARQKMERSQSNDASQGESSRSEKDKLNKEEQEEELAPVKVSFQAADAEGYSAMEQRIQQLAQTLSRVGRVLYRHREASLEAKNFATVTQETLREVVQSPLTVASDGQVVAWMWNHEDGIVRSLLSSIEAAECASPSLKDNVKAVVAKYENLSKFGHPVSYSSRAVKLPMMPAQGRRQLNAALLEFRCILLDELDAMAEDFKKKKNTILNDSTNGQSSSGSNKNSAETFSKLALTSAKHSNTVSTSTSDSSCVSPETGSVPSSVKDPVKEKVNGNLHGGQGTHWLRHYDKRFKIQAAADLLLLYANTGTFFLMQPYRALESTPVEVYARELGNAVPRSAIDTKAKRYKLSKNNGLCDPEEIVSKVTVKYQGDYVLSQLLQWYNGGIGQKPGLPDLIGCVLLPQMAGCWKDNGKDVDKKKWDRPTFYEKRIRPMMTSWLRDPLLRGSPFPKEIRKAFTGNEKGEILMDTSTMWLPFGSPILDLLVSGDDTNIQIVLEALGGKQKTSSDPNGGPKSTADSLLSATVDQGRPAQAVSNWVQCENPDCLKWRKIPWHVDIDLLSKHFVCSDNRWNPSANSCEAPEDTWDEADNVVCGWEPSPKKEISSSCIPVTDSVKPSKREILPKTDLARPVEEEKSFNNGDRYDVLRSWKTEFCVGIVIDVDMTEKRVKFSFPKKKSKFDEWIAMGSKRIAPLGSKTKRGKKDTKTTTQSSRSDRLPNKKRKVITDTNSTDEETTAPTKTSEKNSHKSDAPAAADFGRIKKKSRISKNQQKTEKENVIKRQKNKSEEDGKCIEKRGRISPQATVMGNEKSISKRRILMDEESPDEENNNDATASAKPTQKDISRSKDEWSTSRKAAPPERLEKNVQKSDAPVAAGIGRIPQKARAPKNQQKSEKEINVKQQRDKSEEGGKCIEKRGRISPQPTIAVHEKSFTKRRILLDEESPDEENNTDALASAKPTQKYISSSKDESNTILKTKSKQKEEILGSTEDDNSATAIREKLSQKQRAGTVEDSLRIPRRNSPSKNKEKCVEKDQESNLYENKDSKELNPESPGKSSSVAGRIPRRKASPLVENLGSNPQKSDSKSLSSNKETIDDGNHCSEKHFATTSAKPKQKDISTSIDESSSNAQTKAKQREEILGSAEDENSTTAVTEKSSQKQRTVTAEDTLRIPRRNSPTKNQENRVEKDGNEDRKNLNPKSPGKTSSAAGQIPRRKASPPVENLGSNLQKNRSESLSSNREIVGFEKHLATNTPRSRDKSPPRQTRPPRRPSPTSVSDAAGNSSYHVHNPRRLQFGADHNPKTSQTQSPLQSNKSNGGIRPELDHGDRSDRDRESKDIMRDVDTESHCGSTQGQGYRSPGELDDVRSPGELDDETVGGNSDKGNYGHEESWRENGYRNGMARNLDQDLDRGASKGLKRRIRETENLGAYEDDRNRHMSRELYYNRGQDGYRANSISHRVDNDLRGGFSSDRYRSPCNDGGDLSDGRRNDAFGGMDVGAVHSDYRGGRSSDSYGAARSNGRVIGADHSDYREDRFGSPRNDRNRSGGHGSDASRGGRGSGSNYNEYRGGCNNDRYVSPRSDGGNRSGGRRNDVCGSRSDDKWSCDRETQGSYWGGSPEHSDRVWRGGRQSEVSSDAGRPVISRRSDCPRYGESDRWEGGWKYAGRYDNDRDNFNGDRHRGEHYEYSGNYKRGDRDGGVGGLDFGKGRDEKRYDFGRDEGDRFNQNRRNGRGCIDRPFDDDRDRFYAKKGDGARQWRR